MSKIFKYSYALCRPGIYLLLHRSRRTRVVLICAGKVLLIKSNFGEQKWGLPGGGIKRKETARESAVRETFEETGVVIAKDKLRFLEEKRSGFGPWGWPYVTLVFYTYRLADMPKRLKLQRFEVSEAQWFTQKDIETNDEIETEISLVIKSSLQ